MRRLALLALLLTALPSLGCGDAGGAAAADDGRPRVVATTGMIADVARRVAGERAEVTQLVGPGVDPHLYSPTRGDVAAVSRTDLVLYNGLLLEGKMTDALSRAADAGRRVRAVAEAVPEDQLIAPQGYDAEFDPHVWMDPSAWAEVVAVVRDELAAVDPDGAAEYAANAAAVAAEVAELDVYAERVLSSVPEDRRVLVTAHDAFNYFGRRFGYEVVGIQGLSTESEAGVRDIERIVGLLVDRGIEAVFVESTLSDRSVRALIGGAAARGHEVTIGGRLFSDAMGPGGAYEGTYVGMIDHNVSTIARALGGDVPDGGMRGKLADLPPAEPAQSP